VTNVKQKRGQIYYKIVLLALTHTHTHTHTHTYIYIYIYIYTYLTQQEFNLNTTTGEVLASFDGTSSIVFSASEIVSIANNTMFMIAVLHPNYFIRY